MQDDSNEREVVFKRLGFLGYPKYAIGDDGSVWSKWRKVWKELKIFLDKDGYQCIDLNSGNKCIGKMKVHRLVLLAFVGPCPEGMECCHNDNNRANNDLTNLRWDTKKNNHKDRAKFGTLNRGESSGTAKLTEADVKEMRMLNTQGIGCVRLGRTFNISSGQAYRIVKRLRWKHVE